MEERRKYVRIPEKSQITYKVIPAAGADRYVTKNISANGIKFLVHKFIPKKSLLKIRLTFGRAPLALEGMVRVVWIREVPNSGDYEIGVQFIDIPRKAADHLIEYINAFLRAENK